MPPPTPNQLATPYPPGRYAPTPGARSDDDTEGDEVPRGPSMGRIAGMQLRRALLALAGAMRTVLWALWTPLRMLRGVSWPSLAKWAALGALVACIVGAQPLYQASVCLVDPYRSAALTDRRRAGWRLPIGFKDAPYEAPEVPADSLNALISRLSTVERGLATLAASDRSHADREQADTRDLSRRISSVEAGAEKHVADVQRNVDALRQTLVSLTTDVSADRKAVHALEDKTKRSLAEVASLRDRVSEVEQAVRSDKLARIVGEHVDKLLPPRLAVSVDPKTGKLDISRAFWDALRGEFVDHGEARRLLGDTGGRAPASSGRTSAPTWADFLAANEGDLHRMLDAKVEASVKSGAILSKDAFRDLLEREIRSQIKAEVRGGLEDRINDNVQDIGRELLGKMEKQQATLRSRVDALAQQKPSTIRTPAGTDLHAVVNEIVEAALLRYTKDVIARADFALYTAGARVVPALTTATYEVQPSGVLRRLLGVPFGVGVIRGRPPVVALHPDTHVGACWSFAGTMAQLGVRLSRTINVDAVVLEHAAPELVADRGSAPADFEVWGEVADREAAMRLATARANGDLDATSDGQVLVSALPPSPNHVLLVAGRYDASTSASTHIQTFEVPAPVKRLELPVGVVILRILGLHGDTGPGCLYRFRTLGAPVEG
jgi:hypothetical protein